MSGYVAIWLLKRKLGLERLVLLGSAWALGCAQHHQAIPDPASSLETQMKNETDLKCVLNVFLCHFVMIIFDIVFEPTFEPYF